MSDACEMHRVMPAHRVAPPTASPASAPCHPTDRVGANSRTPLFLAVSVSASVVFAGVIIARGVGRWGVLHLALPIGAVAIVAIVSEFRSRPVSFLASVAMVWAFAWPVALGTLGVVVPYVLDFAWSGSLGDLARSSPTPSGEPPSVESPCVSGMARRDVPLLKKCGSSVSRDRCARSSST